MTILRTAAAVLTLITGTAIISSAAAGSQLQCKHGAADYAPVIRYFEAEAVKARALADRNPLHESDVAYYTSALADARSCHRIVGPVATASR